MRLIDADELLEKFTDEYLCNVAPKHLQIIRSAPTVEAVKVVRCKNCLAAMELKDGAKNYFQPECLLCGMGRGDPSMGYSVVLPDDFCSDGIYIEQEDSQRENND